MVGRIRGGGVNRSGREHMLQPICGEVFMSPVSIIGEWITDVYEFSTTAIALYGKITRVRALYTKLSGFCCIKYG